MRMRAGVQHYTATRACKLAAEKLVGNSCEFGRVRHPPNDCCRVANAGGTTSKNVFTSHQLFVATRSFARKEEFLRECRQDYMGTRGPGNWRW